MAESTERRLAAILAADVVDYSRLMEADEAGTLAAMKAHRAELWDRVTKRHGGRIVGTAGDSLLIEFTSAVAAVDCALAVQEGMAVRNQGLDDAQCMRLRIGVNLGEVIVEGEDIFGEGVNIAARLESLATPGSIAVSGVVHDQVAGKTQGAFTDDGEHEVKNISRPVRVWRWTAASVAPALAGLVGEAPRLPDKPSIAVLPFQNMSDDAEQEFFADGMTEDIITELSRFDMLFVIARNSAFVYKGRAVDIKDVARELGVHFVLEGSVRKLGPRIRITAQLIDGRDGRHLWAERYDGRLADIFELQEAVTAQVVGAIWPEIDQAELARSGTGERKFDAAYELAWSAREMARKSFRHGDPGMLRRALETAEAAIEANAKCIVGYETICESYMLQSLLRWGDDPAGSADLALSWAERFAAELPRSYLPSYCLGMARFRKGQFDEANRDFARAHGLNPNDAQILRHWAWCAAAAGAFDDAKAHARLAIRLNPKGSGSGVAALALAMAAFIEGAEDDFEEWASLAIQEHPHAPIRRTMMIAWAAETGNDALLKTHLDMLTIFAPDFIDSLFRGENRVFQQDAHMEKLLGGLRKAGFPR